MRLRSTGSVASVPGSEVYQPKWHKVVTNFYSNLVYNPLRDFGACPGPHDIELKPHVGSV